MNAPRKNEDPGFFLAYQKFHASCCRNEQRKADEQLKVMEKNDPFIVEIEPDSLLILLLGSSSNPQMFV